MDRRLVFREGTSDKYWEIAVDGSATTVRFGRVGTAGQEKVKDHGSSAAAVAAADKLIAEKLRKGYADEGGSPPAAPGKAPASAAAPAPAATRRPATTKAAKKKPEVAPPPPVPVSASLDGAGEDGVLLTPFEAAIAVRAPLPPPPPDPAPFEAKEALRRLRTGREGHDYTSGWSFPSPPVGPAATAEEAAWWIAAASMHYPLSNPRKAAAAVEKGGVTPPPTDPRQMLAVAAASDLPRDLAMVCLAALVGPDELLGLLVEPYVAPPGSSYWQREDRRVRLVLTVRPHLLPRCSDMAVEAARQEVRARLATAAWPLTSDYETPDIAFHLAGVLGLEAEAGRAVSTWPDGHYSPSSFHDHYQRPLPVVLGIGDPDVIVGEAVRTGVPLRHVDDVVAWIAATGMAGLEHLERNLAAVDKREAAAEMVAAAASRLHGPAAAPMFVELVVGSKAPSEAKAWLDAHPRAATAGAGPMALRPGRAGEVALAAVRRAGRDAPEAMAAGLAHLDGATAARLTTKLAEAAAAENLPVLDAGDDAPTWLAEALASEAAAGGKAAALPPWTDPADLPPVVVRGARLDAELMGQLVASLALSAADAPRPLVAAVIDRAEARSRDAVAVALLDAWLAEGGPSKQKWVFQAVGLIGHDATAMRLAPMIRAWPGESQHQRAVAGLGVLAAIGTDTALQQISGIAEKVKFKALQQRAREAMEEIAAARGLSKDELEDRIVPDGGLDERGTRRLDYGSRAFLVTLGPGGKPMVREEGPDGRPTGKARPDLPAVSGKDDAAVANATKAEWKLLKKQVADVAKVQTARLERAMVSGRRWSPADHDQLLARHPLLGQLVRPLVWGAWDADGGLKVTFRVTDEGDLADVEDRPVTPDAKWRIGIVHPLHLDAATARRWGQVLADYELLAPFPQLSRPVFAIEPGERKVVDLTRYEASKVPAISLAGTLERLGWNRGPVQDAGAFHEHAKAFFSAGVTAVAEHDYMGVGYISESPDQGVDRCFFVPGIYLGGGSYVYPEHKDRIPWGQVDPVVVSEVLADLEAVAAKAG